jgi:hypothetical protein
MLQVVQLLITLLLLLCKDAADQLRLAHLRFRQLHK